MTVCRFFEQGYCRNGSACRFEHPGANANTGNRFSALGGTATKIQDGLSKYKFSRDMIKLDLESDHPTWILSAYGPGKDAPEQLFGGYPREQSLEEVMVYVRGSANPEQAKIEVQQLYTQAQQQIQTTLANIDAAVEYILSAEDKHPNRNDICKQGTIAGGTNGVFARTTGIAGNTPSSNMPGNPFSTTTTTQANPFSSGAASGMSAFGQPSTLGQKANPFSGATQSTFGQPSQLGGAATSAFGQPSQLGAAAPAFGQPSQLGAAAPAFGQPSQLGAAAPAFGQPSQLGAAAPAFGQPSQLGGGTSAFGQPSNLGQKPNPFSSAATQSAFGQPSTLGQTNNPFSNPSAPAAANLFSQSGAATTASPFAQLASGANTTASPFAQVGAQTAAQAPAPNPFARTTVATDMSLDSTPAETTPTNPFAPSAANSGFSSTASTLTNNPFGTTSITSPLGGAPTNTQPQANPFSRPSQPQPQSQPQAAPAPSKAGPYAPNSTKQHRPVENYITRSANGEILTFQKQPIVCKWIINGKLQDQPPPPDSTGTPVAGIRTPDGSWRKIFFPQGPPAYNRDTEPEDPASYTEDVAAAYRQMAQKGRFTDGIPEVPPLREDCSWIF